MRGIRNTLITIAFWGACAVPLEDGGDAGPVMEDHPDAPEDSGEQGGIGTSPVFHLPLRAGNRTRCAQGPDGSYSHQSRSTRYGVDLDTSNTADEELFAPVSGIARVHRDDPARNFGIHINIDLGDGTFVLLGHLKEAFVADEEAVVEGQMLGFEGCTGVCTGDHVHMGYQRGAAGEKAERSESLPFALLAWDRTQADGIGETPVADLACGLADGEVIHSVLPVACAHPDGSLVKTPGDPKVYRIDDGVLRWIVNESVFHEYGYDFADVVLMSEGEIETYGFGPDIAGPGMVEGGVDDDGQYWLFVAPRSRADRYRIRVREEDAWEVYASWGLEYGAQYDPQYVAGHEPLMREWPVRAGYAPFRDGTLLKESFSPRVYAVSHGIPMPFDDEAAFRIAGYDFSRVLEVADGAIARQFPLAGNCSPGGVGCLSLERVRTCLPITAEGFPSVGGSGETEELPEPEAEDAGPPEDLSLGELAIVYRSPEDEIPMRMILSYEVEADGEIVLPMHQVAFVEDEREITVRSLFIAPGATLRFSVERLVEHAVRYSCQDGWPRGDARVYFGEEELGLTVEANGVGGCNLGVAIPVPAETDAQPQTAPAEENDDGAQTRDAGPAPTNPCEIDDVVACHPQTDGGTPDAGSGIPDAGPPAAELRTLNVSWTMPLNRTARRITLSGEYRLADGSYGFLWDELAEETERSSIVYALEGVESGDTFRFSVEFEAVSGDVSWSCIGPFVPGDPAHQGTRQGRVEAAVDGAVTPVENADDPTSTGCGLLVQVP